jgi:type VI secretion system protein ImpC
MSHAGERERGRTFPVTTSESAAAEPSLLDQIINQSRMARDEEQRSLARDLLGEFVDEFLSGRLQVSADTTAMLRARIAEIDRLISRQLNEIMHHPEFQRLEAAWRGLHYLVHQAETGPNIRVRVLNVSKQDLLRDFERAAEFDQSALFRKVYEEEFGTFGGTPFGVLVGDFEFSRHPQDLALLSRLSNVAAAAHTPLLTAASPMLFGFDSYTEMSGPRDLSMIFRTREYTKWQAFRDSEDARYVGLCVPHILMRLPYGSDGNPVEAFNFEEDVDGSDHGKYLWGNAAYAFASRLVDSFQKYHWCASIRGVEGGGLVEGLPVHTFRTDQGDVALKCPTEIAITDRRERELAELGFIPLVHCKGTDYAAFFSAQSCQAPRVYDNDAANANARLSAQLPYVLAISRVAHYLKAMTRDKIGSYVSREETERDLNRWVSQYVTTDPDASNETKARYPLSEARVDVIEDPRRPGELRAVVFLRPHFQLDDLTVSLRLVASLPKPPGQ